MSTGVAASPSSGRWTRRRHALLTLAAAAAIMVAAAWLYALFGPLYSGTETTVTGDGSVSVRNETESLLEHGIHPLAWVAFGIFGACGVAMALAAVGLVARAPWEPLMATIIVASIVLLGMSWVTGLSIGFYFLPGALCGLAALVLVVANPAPPW